MAPPIHIFRLFYNNGTDIAAAAALAKRCDFAVVFVATLSHEGGDRASLSLDDGCVTREKNGKPIDNQCAGNADNQNQMVAAVAAANRKTIVVASVYPWLGLRFLTGFLGGPTRDAVNAPNYVPRRACSLWYSSS